MQRTFWSATFDRLGEFYFILIVTGRKTMQFLFNCFFRYLSCSFKWNLYKVFKLDIKKTLVVCIVNVESPNALMSRFPFPLGFRLPNFWASRWLIVFFWYIREKTFFLPLTISFWCLFGCRFSCLVVNIPILGVNFIDGILGHKDDKETQIWWLSALTFSQNWINFKNL